MFNKSLDGILAPLIKIQKDLNKYINNKSINLNKNNEKIDELNDKNASIVVDIQDASDIKKEFDKMLGE